MQVYEIDPQSDPRWSALVESDWRSSVFHAPQWLEALRRTYGYTPTVLTTSPPGSPLTSALALCGVRSWLTGSRMVSVPFADHCEPLVPDAAALQTLLSEIRHKKGRRLRYVEVRPRFLEPLVAADLRQQSSYCSHVLDLTPNVEDIYKGLHKDSMRRKIRRARRESLAIRQGRSEALLQQFYALLLLTRRRHGIPPQPLAWFRNLIEAFGTQLTIRVASFNGFPVASILTLRHKKTLVYKYGCSDAHFHNLGGMPFLFWDAIQAAKADQLQEFDLGRSNENNLGLIRFKDNLGASRGPLRYWRMSREVSDRSMSDLWQRIPQRVLQSLPDALFRMAGKALYRHSA